MLDSCSCKQIVLKRHLACFRYIWKGLKAVKYPFLMVLLSRVELLLFGLLFIKRNYEKGR